MRVALALLTLVLATGGAAAARPASTLTGIDASLKKMAASGRFSGDVLIAKRGKPVLTRAYGLANRTTRERNRPDTRFNLASVGKTFTAVAVARLVDEGKLGFDDPVGRYIPELPSSLGSSITVGELLDHTSGLGDFFESASYEQLRPTLTSLDRYLPLIVDAAPVAAPGSGFHYSNSGYILLGLIVQRVSGVDYYAFLRREVFAPAGMTKTACLRNSTLGRGVAIGYTGGATPNTRGLPPRGSSAGGCYSTVGDLLRFANALTGDRLLSPALTATITSPKVTVGRGSAYGYGFGIRTGPPGSPATIWHNGGSPGVGAELDVNPALGYTVVVLANTDYPVIQPAIDLILNRLKIP